MTVDHRKINMLAQDEPLPEAIKATEEAQIMLTVATSFPIESNEDFLAANDDLKIIKAKYREIEEKRKFLKEPALEQGRRIDAMFRPALDTLSSAERAYKKSMGAWQDEQDRIRREAEAKARALFLKAEQERIKALDSGNDKKLAKAEEKIAAAAALVEAAPEVPKAAGFHQVEVWSAEIVDIDSLPREFMLPDLKKLDDVAKALQGKFNVPGARAVMTKRQVSR